MTPFGLKDDLIKAIVVDPKIYNGFTKFPSPSATLFVHKTEVGHSGNRRPGRPAGEEDYARVREHLHPAPLHERAGKPPARPEHGNGRGSGRPSPGGPGGSPPCGGI